MRFWLSCMRAAFTSVSWYQVICWAGNDIIYSEGVCWGTKGGSGGKLRGGTSVCKDDCYGTGFHDGHWRIYLSVRLHIPYLSVVMEWVWRWYSIYCNFVWKAEYFCDYVHGGACPRVRFLCLPLWWTKDRRRSRVGPLFILEFICHVLKYDSDLAPESSDQVMYILFAQGRSPIKGVTPSGVWISSNLHIYLLILSIPKVPTSKPI